MELNDEPSPTAMFFITYAAPSSIVEASSCVTRHKVMSADVGMITRSLVREVVSNAEDEEKEE